MEADRVRATANLLDGQSRPDIVPLVQRFTSRSDASARCLIGANAAHDEPSPALARKRISFPSCRTLLLFVGLLHALSIARPLKGGTFFPRSFLFFFLEFEFKSGKASRS